MSKRRLRDIRQIERAAKRLRRAGRDMRPVWRELRKPLRADQREHIDEQKDSDGRSWQGLARSTIERRLRQGGRRRNYTRRGKLKKRAAKRISRTLSKRLVVRAKIESKRDRMTIKSRVPWAGVHQFGGRAGRNAVIPKREFMYIGDKLLRKTVKLSRRHLTRAWFGRRR